MIVSIVIPVAKEGDTLYNRIIKLSKQLNMIAEEQGLKYEVILVTDVFHKPTLRAMMKLAREGVTQSLFLTKRIGKGGSIKNAIPYTRGSYIVLLDADIPVKPTMIQGAVLRAARCRVDLLIANRVYRSHGLLRRLLSIAYNNLVNLLFKTRLKDHQAGFKILSRKAAWVILVGRTRTDGLAYDTEAIVWAKINGYKYDTINVIWQEQRKESTIPPLRAMLTMLADIIVLRLLTLTRKHATFKKVVVGKIIDLNSLNTIGPEYMTIIETQGLKKYLLNLLRKIYIVVAFRRNEK
jgi:glycosyltransferase involved in cell wall biosynthesis